MKYIKDFFYNLSDLIIILFILVLAGGLIFWRVNVIMDYPEALAAEVKNSSEQAETANADADAEADANAEANAEAGADANAEANADADANAEANANADSNADANSEAANSDSNAAANSDSNTANSDSATANSNTSGPRDNTIWKDGKLRVDMSVELASGSSEAAVESLVQAGLFASYDEFAEVCDRIGADHDMVLALTYTFPAGSTQEDIAREVTIE